MLADDPDDPDAIPEWKKKYLMDSDEEEQKEEE